MKPYRITILSVYAHRRVDFMYNWQPRNWDWVVPINYVIFPSWLPQYHKKIVVTVARNTNWDQFYRGKCMYSEFQTPLPQVVQYGKLVRDTDRVAYKPVGGNGPLPRGAPVQ